MRGGLVAPMSARQGAAHARISAMGRSAWAKNTGAADINYAAAIGGLASFSWRA